MCILPNAGPDIKYLLGFIRTQMSTSVTIGLVFGPKVARVLRGQGDQWDNRARFRGITTTFISNGGGVGGGGLMQEDALDPYVENEELKEEMQKLAAQIEFLRIVNMKLDNFHLKPKASSYFTVVSVFQSPQSRSGGGGGGAGGAGGMVGPAAVAATATATTSSATAATTTSMATSHTQTSGNSKQHSATQQSSVVSDDGQSVDAASSIG